MTAQKLKTAVLRSRGKYARRRRRSLRRIAWVLAALGATLVLTSPAGASGPAPDRATANFEVDFMSGMIDHHAMAIEMADVCPDNAVHSELRAMCEDIMTAQGEEIATMQSWLKDWYGVTHEPEMRRSDMRMLEKLASLAGGEFEISFMESMIKHHRKAIVRAERCVDRAYHGDLRELCQGIVETQSAEITQMQTWLCQWYGRCREAG